MTSANFQNPIEKFDREFWEKVEKSVKGVGRLIARKKENEVGQAEKCAGSLSCESKN